jgi:hypothetical protein
LGVRIGAVGDGVHGWRCKIFVCALSDFIPYPTPAPSPAAAFGSTLR